MTISFPGSVGAVIAATSAIWAWGAIHTGDGNLFYILMFLFIDTLLLALLFEIPTAIADRRNRIKVAKYNQNKS